MRSTGLPSMPTIVPPSTSFWPAVAQADGVELAPLLIGIGWTGLMSGRRMCSGSESMSVMVLPALRGPGAAAWGSGAPKGYRHPGMRQSSRFDGVQPPSLLERCRRELSGFGGSILSMGMSNDYEIAVEEGSTEVRLGTVLLGPRPGE